MVDIFKLDGTGIKGSMVSKFDSLVWTERYLKQGDFKIVKPYTESARTELPIGSYISHFDTLEIMEVRDHYVKKSRGKAPILTITGSSFEGILEDRMAVPSASGLRTTITDDANAYLLTSNPTWLQAKLLIEHHLSGVGSGLVSAYDKTIDIAVVSLVDGTETPLLNRVIERGQLYPKIIELLGSSGCGIKSRRPHSNSIRIELVIHRGLDRSSTVSLSARLDELDEAEYFWSNRQYKNAALVCGKYDALTILPDGVELMEAKDIKWVYVDASDIEDNPSVVDPEPLRARGKAALNASTLVELTNFEIASTNRFKYNRDYMIGDVVNVAGDFNVNKKVIVEEFTWSHDDSGVFGYPTLTPLT